MQKRLYLFLNLDLSVAAIITGYILGLFIPFLSVNARIVFDVQTVSSAFISGGGFNEFLYTACKQSIYPMLIFLLGFIPCSSMPCSGILFMRAALASYSSLIIFSSGASNRLYILHALCSISMIAICWALSKCAISYGSDERTNKSSLLYTFKFLFFVGLIFIIVFCRHIALAFI